MLHFIAANKCKLSNFFFFFFLHTMTKAWNIPKLVTMLNELYSIYVGQMEREIDKNRLL